MKLIIVFTLENVLKPLIYRLLPEPSEWWTDQPDKPVSIRYDTSPATSEVPETVLQLFQRTVASHGDHYATGVKRQGEWRMATYQQYFEQCCTAAKAFIEVRERWRREGAEGLGEGK